MAELNMEPGEYAIEQLGNVSINRGPLTTDLVLTNKHLWVVDRTTFTSRAKSVRKYRVDQVTVVNGQAQLKIEKRYGHRTLTILFKNGEKLEIGSVDNADYAGFAGQINLLLTGAAIAPAERSRTAVDDISANVQGVFAALDPRVLFGARRTDADAQNGQPGTQAPRATSAQCAGCHAPINGYVGQIAICGYCDTEQRL